MGKVLILTHEDDPHANSVRRYLNEKRIENFTVITEKLLEDYKIKFASDGLSYRILNGKEKVDLDPSWNIWNRRIMLPDKGKGMPKSLQDLVIDECEKTWDGLLMAHEGKVVNRPQNHLYANNKLDQLRIALQNKNGIYVPDTIVTTDPKDLKDFYDKHNGNICFKLQKGSAINTPEGVKIIYTNKISEEDVKKADMVSTVPSMFQEYIEKDYEVRVISTNRDSTGIAIHSQDSDSEQSKIDYRRYDFDNVKYKKINLPQNVKTFCSNMLKNYGLNFGVYDFIYGKDGKYTFLELNPNGQWLWLEEQSGHDLTKQVAENLVN